MSSRLTDYFGIKRDSFPVSDEKLEGSDSVLKAHTRPLVSKPSIHQVPSIQCAPSGSRLKTKQTASLHKTKPQRKAKLRNAPGKTRSKPVKLPAYMRFAYLAQQELPVAEDTIVSDQNGFVCVSSRSVVDEDAQKPVKSARSSCTIGSEASHLEHAGSSGIAQTKVCGKTLGFMLSQPELANFSSCKSASSLQKSDDVQIESQRIKEIEALTKSDSCPTTPIRGNVLPRTNSSASNDQPKPCPPATSALHLPFHMERLFELFRACETLVSTLHNRHEVCSFDKIKPAVQEVVRCDFTESTVGQFSTVYPLAYSYRYDKQLDKVTKLQLDTYTLVFVPNLRTDGTQMAYDSPTKGHLVFTGTRLIQRRHIFRNSLLLRVKKAHREFLMMRFHLSDGDLPEDSSLRRWHPSFALDTAVPEIIPSPLPPRPSLAMGDEAKITSAREAVAAFASRSLFREAEACEKLVLRSETGGQDHGYFVKASMPAGTTKASLSVLKGVSASLLAKVREREKRLNLSILTQPAASTSERAAFAALPVTITQIWREMRSFNGRPVPLSFIATRLVQSSESGLSFEEAVGRIESLLSLVPNWLEKVAWARPHLRFKGNGADRPLKEVISEAKAEVAKRGGAQPPFS